MAKCRRCRKETPDEAVYCVHCGLSTWLAPDDLADATLSGTVQQTIGERVVSTYGSIPFDELPPEVRALLQGTGKGGETLITYRDSSGQEQTYRSIDDLPPEVREKFRQVLEAAPQSGETLRVETRRTYDLPIAPRKVHIRRAGCATWLLAVAGLLIVVWGGWVGSG